jgi:hypothetical protein
MNNPCITVAHYEMMRQERIGSDDLKWHSILALLRDTGAIYNIRFNILDTPVVENVMARLCGETIDLSA